MTQALNAFYGIGKVIEAGRSAQGVDFVLGLRNVRTDVQLLPWPQAPPLGGLVPEGDFV
jgi:hypothetical protein